MLACIPWNFLEHSIMSRSHDVILKKNSCVLSSMDVLEYFVNVYKDSFVS